MDKQKKEEKKPVVSKPEKPKVVSHTKTMEHFIVTPHRGMVKMCVKGICDKGNVIETKKVIHQFTPEQVKKVNDFILKLI